MKYCAQFITGNREDLKLFYTFISLRIKANKKKNKANDIIRVLVFEWEFSPIGVCVCAL